MPGTTYTLGVNSGAAVAGVNAIKESFSGLQGVVGRVGSALGLLGVSFAAFKSLGGFTDGLRGVAESGKELSILSATTGQTIGDLVVLKKTFKDALGGSDGLSESLGMLQRSLGGVNDSGAPTGEVFARLGLSIARLKGESAVAQFEQIGAAIRHLGSQEERAATAQAIFGRGGMEMMAIFSDTSAITDAKASMSGYAALMEKDSGMFRRITEDLESLSGKVKGFFIGFADQVGPVLLPLLEKLKQFNLSGIGAEAGAIVKTLAAAFGSGQISELVGASLEFGATRFANTLLGGITGFASAFGTFWGVVIQDWEGLFSKIPSIGNALKDGFIGAIEAAGAVMLDVFNKPIIAVQAGLEYAMQTLIEKMPRGLQKMMGFGGGITHESYDQIAARRKEEGANLFGRGAEDLAASSMDHFGKAKAAVADVSDGIDIKGLVSEVMASFKQGISGGKLLDESGLKEKVMKIVSDINAHVPKAQAEKRTGGMGGGPIGKPDLAAMRKAGLDAIPPLTPMSDRLSKIGLFVGGKEGSKSGQDAAAKDTAKHTERIVALTAELVAIQKGQVHGKFKGNTF